MVKCMVMLSEFKIQVAQKMKIKGHSLVDFRVDSIGNDLDNVTNTPNDIAPNETPSF